MTKTYTKKMFGYCGGLRAVSLSVNRSAMFVEAVLEPGAESKFAHAYYVFSRRSILVPRAFVFFGHVTKQRAATRQRHFKTSSTGDVNGSSYFTPPGAGSGNKIDIRQASNYDQNGDFVYQACRSKLYNNCTAGYRIYHSRI